jgi:hypothetical protein
MHRSIQPDIYHIEGKAAFDHTTGTALTALTNPYLNISTTKRPKPTSIMNTPTTLRIKHDIKHIRSDGTTDHGLT